MTNNKFPNDFVWGSATSAYQIEGGWLEGGKGLSIWDAFSHIPGKIKNGDTGDVSCDHYHRFKDDVKLMKELGINAYRFSISWPRIQPTGKGAANPEGIKFYNNLINELIDNDIDPWIALHHWDLPLALDMELDGWLNPSIAECFRDYAEICFSSFGDRVKNWITFNEAWVISLMGYGTGAMAPGRTSLTEPYIAGHNLLRSHAKAVALYRDKFAAKQKGRITIVNNCDFRMPKTSSAEDQEAAERAVLFFLGWFSDPVFLGDYPEVMRERLGKRLPYFSPDDAASA